MIRGRVWVCDKDKEAIIPPIFLCNMAFLFLPLKGGIYLPRP